MIIKIGATEITVPEFISSELNKKKNRKLFDNFLHTILSAQGQRIRNALQKEHEQIREQQDMLERIFLQGWSHKP